MTNTTIKHMESEAIMTIKLVSYPIAAFALNYLGINAEVMAILAILLVLDVATGVLRVALTEPQKLSSRTGIIGILSKLLVILVPLLVGLVGKGVGIDVIGLVNFALSAIVVYEGWSVLGNIVQIRTKDVTLNEYDAVSAVIHKLQDAFKAILSTMLEQVPAKGEDKK